MSKTFGLTSSPQFILYLKNYFPGHYFPYSWDMAKYLKAISFIGFFLAFFYRAPSEENQKIIKAFAGGVFFLWFVAFLFSEIIPLRAPIILMPFRSDIFFVTFGLLYAAHYITKLIFSQKVSHPVMALLLTLTLTDIQLFTPISLITLCGLFLAFFANEERDATQVNTFKNVVSFLYVLALICVFLLCVLWLQYEPLKIKSYLLILITLSFLIISEKPLKSAAMTWKKNLYIIRIIILCLLTNFDLISYRIKAGQLSFVSQIRSDWKKVQRWAKDNTPPASLFVVPPYINGFRTFSKRSVFVEKIDAGAMH